jgi:protein-tyrosine phosphatase
MLLRAALAIILASTTVAHADVTNLLCTQTGPTEYKLSYSLTGPTHQVQIFAGTKPEPSTTGQPLLKTGDTEVTVHAGKPGERIFFFLKADTGEQRVVSIRHLPLEGTPNFRDLGGYETTDGHYVRWGLIYRSGVLTYLTPADMTYLAQTGIRVVCDFRTQQENEAAPEKWIPAADVKHISLPIGTEKNKDGNATVQSMVAGHPTTEQLRATMTKTYGNFAFSSAPQYAAVFEQLERDQLPLLYHCTAGKDRTGVFSTFLLLTLGVPEKTVLEDYALTNKYLLDQPHSAAMQKMMTSTGNNALAGLTPEQQQVMMAADPEYLKSTLRTIETKYGSFDNYRRQELHVSDDQAATLRARLLMR